MSPRDSKPLMRSLGEFVGHIVKAVRTNPGRTVVSKRVEEKREGQLTLRRTTIEEVEIKSDDASGRN